MFKKYSLFIAIFFLILYFCPYIFLQENSHFFIGDNLDSAVPQLVILARGSKIFELNSQINTSKIMSIVPSDSVADGFNIIMIWLFKFFKPFTAYLINEIMIHLIAFFGMYLLLKDHFIKDKHYHWICAGVSLCFAILPFYTVNAPSIAGQPILLYAFLNILEYKSNIWNYIIIFLFPFYSNLLIAGFFIICILGFIFMVDWISSKRLNISYFTALVLLTFIYIITEYHSIYAILFDKIFVSHRTEWNVTLWSLNLKGVFTLIIGDLLNGHYHAVSLQRWIAIFILPLAIIAGLKKRFDFKLLSILLISISTISIFHGAYNWDKLIPLKEKIMILKIYQFDRFYLMFPILWYLVFAISLLFIAKAKFKLFGMGKYLVLMIISIQFLFILFNNPTHKNFIKKDNKSFTYREFYSEDLFRKIRDYINKPQKDYRIVSIGIYPAISQYNGFYSLDGYLANYSLEYKHKFRRIIEKELNKNETRQKYFDDWGNRYYIFASELSNFENTKYDNVRLKNLELNTDYLKNLEGEYIFSAVEIINYKDNKLDFLHVFEDGISPWRIYLYKLS